MRLFLFSIIIFLQINFLNAIEFIGKFEQGSFILGKTKPDSKVQIDNRKVRVTDDGYFAFGLDRDRKNDVIIKIIEKGNLETIQKKVLKREYKIQRIDGLPPKQVTPPPEVYERIKNDNKLIISARATEDGNLYGSIGTAEIIDSIKYSAHNTEKEFDQLSAIDVTFVDSTVSSIKNINDITQIRIAGHEVHVSVVAATDA